MKPFKYAVTGDWQVPFHDEHAIDVAQQVIAAFKPDTLDYNGDIFDMPGQGKFPGFKTHLNKKRWMSLQAAIEIGQGLMQRFAEEIQPKKVVFKDGNHEQRLHRVVANANSDLIEVLELPQISAGITSVNIFSLDKLQKSSRFEHFPYPQGNWAHPDLPHDANVYVEHGNQVAAKAGYTAGAVVEKRGTSIVINHVHRLSLAWKHLVGNRDFFAIENGGLSILGESDHPGMYFGSPYSAPDMLNHAQGFSLLTYQEGVWSPELVRIKHGVASWRGKTYKSRIKKESF